MKPRARDVALLAGVSPATVDRVLKGRGMVHARTQERVWAAARKLDYSIETIGPGVDVILPAAESPFMDQLEAALFARAFEVGMNLRVTRQALLDPISYGDWLIETAKRPSAKSEAVALTAPDHPAIREGVRALRTAGIPVFTVTADLPGSGHSGYVGMENRGVGRLAGQLMNRLLPRRAGSVGVVIGSPFYRNHNEREAGFRSYSSEQASHLSVLPHLISAACPKQAATALRECLKQAPELVGLYNVGGATAAIANTLQEMGRHESVVFIAHDLTEELRRCLIHGSLDVVIDQSAEATAIAVVEALSAARSGRATTPRPLVPQVIFSENLP